MRRESLVNYQLSTTDYQLTFRYDDATEENYDGVCLKIRDHRIRRESLR